MLNAYNLYNHKDRFSLILNRPDDREYTHPALMTRSCHTIHEPEWRCFTKNWGFDELSQAVRESYGNFTRGGLNPGQAVERCLYEYETLKNSMALEPEEMARLGEIVIEARRRTKLPGSGNNGMVDMLYTILKGNIRYENVCLFVTHLGRNGFFLFQEGMEPGKVCGAG